MHEDGFLINRKSGLGKRVAIPFVCFPANKGIIIVLDIRGGRVSFNVFPWQHIEFVFARRH